MDDLTFIYISFAKIFCQNNVKKNCKQEVRIYYKYGGIRRGEGHGMYLSGEPKICVAIAVKRIYCYVKWDLLLCQMGFIVMSVWIYCRGSWDLLL